MFQEATVMLDNLVKEALIVELEALRDQVRAAAEPLGEGEFWIKPVQPGNSVGHLVQHLTGNLNHFVGAQLGRTGYVRDRDREFAGNYAPSKAETLQLLDVAVSLFRSVVGGLTAEQLAAPHPEARPGTVVNALLHLVAHFALHQGQISYLVRLLKPQ
jgi:uncharacterized damage-inducible protein DinB